jgi:type IV pilus assembly protein PilO
MAIDLNDIKKMPAKAKLLVVFLAFFLIGYLYWFYFLSASLEKKKTLNEQLTTVKEKIKEKEKVAGQIKQYMTEVATLQENYKVALQKLPDQKEIPTLFHSVAEAGRDAGVEFLLFEPKPVVPKTQEKPAAEPKAAGLFKPSDQKDQKTADAKTPDKAAPGKVGAAGKKGAVVEEPFYEEIPVSVSVIGTFQNILFFFDKVAKLPRIVNITEISMGDRKDAKGKGPVITSTCIIKTYMFVEKKEKAIEKPSEKPSEKTK